MYCSRLKVWSVVAILLLGGLTSVASAATIVFTGADFNDVAQLDTSGTLIDAAHFGDASRSAVTANGIQFAARGASSSVLSVGGDGAFPVGAGACDASFYQADTHVSGYTSILGLSDADANTFLDGIVYGPGAGNSLVTLSGLTLNHDYRVQLLLVDDAKANGTVYANVYASDAAKSTVYGPYAWSHNAVQLVTGTFTADATSQQLRAYVGGDNNVEINAYQLRDVTPTPEPGTVILIVTGMIGLLAYAWRKRR